MDPEGPIGLVLAGGGARGAYEIGALRVLLERVAAEESGPDSAKDWRPDVIVGTSVGAINAAYIAATADKDLISALDDGCRTWEELMRWESVLSPIPSVGQMRTILEGIGDAIDFPGVHARRLVDSSPLEHSLTHALPGLPDGIPFAQIERNVSSGRITAAAVVTTLAATSLSRVFFASRGSAPPNDDKRGIDYMPADLGVDHVLASAAIPSLFPARWIGDPKDAEGWYVDGGTRLNAPISPTLKLGAERLIIVALNCPVLGRRPAFASQRQPEVLDGAEQLLQAVLIDPLVNDLLTLTRINELVTRIGGQARGASGYGKVVPYILVAPDDPYVIGRIARDVFEERYEGFFNRRRWGLVGILGHQLDVPRDPVRGELFSHLFFDEEFARRLMKQGREDAQRWIDQADRGEHGPLGLWRTSAPV